jgi:hypothetical protein
VSALVALLGLALGLGSEGENGESWRLLQGASRARRIDFHVPYGPCMKAAERLAHELAATHAVSLDPEDRDPGAMRVCVGASFDEDFLTLLAPLGIEPMEGGFCLLGREYGAPGDALRAVFEDPERPGQPLLVLLGNDLELLAAYLDELPRLSRPELVVWAGGDLALVCPLDTAGVPRQEHLHDYLARRERYFEGGATYDVEDVRVHLRHPVARTRWLEYSLALVRACKTTLDWFGVKGRKAPPIELFLYDHLEDFEECLGREALYETSRLEPRAHVLFAEGLPDDAGAAAAEVLAREVGGAPAERWLAQGQALAAAGAFFGWPLEVWVGHLAAGRCLPSFAALSAGDAATLEDELALAPARALLFQQAVAAAPPGAVRALWKGAPLDEKRVAPLYQRRGRTLAEAQAATRRQVPRGATRALPFLNGLALVESSDVRYSSSWIEEALVEARRLEPAPNAVSLTVWAAAENPAPVLAGGSARTAFGSASDLALANAAAAARSFELEVVLALEVLAQPHGSWADALPWASPEDRWDYWRRYERVALHYALLAQLIGAKVFSFGANLRSTPAGTFEGEEASAEQIEQRARSWKGLIARLRGGFQGALTYGASLAGEASAALFYDQLDYLGLLFYPGVPEAGRTPDDELLWRTLRFELQQALDLAVRWDKPLLLLQAGFPARREAFARPSVPRGPADFGAQARALGMLGAVLASKLENADALRGLFLWNWPIDPDPEGAGDRGFSLRGRSLETELAHLFTR